MLNRQQFASDIGVEPKSLSALRTTPLVLLILTSLLVACSCGNDTVDSLVNSDGEPTDGTDSVEKPVEAAEDPLPGFVAALAPKVDRLVKSQSGGGAVEVIQTRLAEKPKRRAKDVLRYRAELTKLYGRDGASLLFVGGGQLSEDGKAVLTALVDSPRHALEADDFRTSEIEKLVTALSASGGTDTPITLTKAESDKLVAALRRGDFDPTMDGADAAAVRLLLGDDSPVPRIKDAANKLEEDAKSHSQTAAELEIALADSLLHYAWEMRFQNKNWWPEEDFDQEDDDRSDKQILRDKLIAKVLEVADRGTIAQWLDELPPHHDQYDKLIAELERYREIEENGGWKEVKKTSLKKGSRSKRVAELKERLRVEGYFPKDAEITEVYDDQMVEAVKSYQTTHQLKVDGESSKWFWKSVNTPVEDRIDQIEVTLDRWRENRIGPDDYYVLVNIPDFHAEVWRDGEREMRFRIVVGNRQMGCDRKKKVWTYVNATPMQSNRIRNVILNPYWNVPERIWREELEPESKEQDNWFEEKGYECVTPDESIEGRCNKVRQKSGPGNALGKVKFIFPNEWNTYMHDTPKKHFFNFPVRSFSHGCMRVQDPLDFAEYLLTQDGQFDKRDFNKILDHGQEQSIRLKDPVPVHIEYYTVRVDDEGRANFLADIYKYDHYRIKGIERKLRKCEPVSYEVSEDEGALDDGTDVDGGESSEAAPLLGPDGRPIKVNTDITKTPGDLTKDKPTIFRALGRDPVKPTPVKKEDAE